MGLGPVDLPALSRPLSDARRPEVVMPCSRLLVLSALPLLLTTVSSAQTSVWTVDDDGPADFHTIGAAVAVSSDGDSILVKAGSYLSFPLLGKGVTIVGEPGVTHVQGHVRIENLSPGQVAVLSNLNAHSSDGEALRAYTNQGSIRLQSCNLLGAYNRGCAIIADSEDVCLVDCVLQGGLGLAELQGGSYWWLNPGGAGAEIQRSTVALYDCIVRGGNGGDEPQDDVGACHGGPGAVVQESFVFLSNTKIQGGNGGSVDYGTNCSFGAAGDGGAGIDLKDLASELQILDSSIVGGGGGGNSGCGSWGTGGPAFAGSGVSLIVQIPGTRREMEVDDHRQLVGSGILATFRGEVGDSVYLPVDWGTAFTFDATVKGTWILPQPPAIPPTPIAVIPASGEIEVELPSTPPIGGNAGQVEYRQMYVVSATGATILGSPAGTLQIACAPHTTYCVGSPNSVGAGADIYPEGSSSVFDNDLVLHSTGCPPDEFGLFFYGPNPVQLPFGDGFRCVGGKVYRLPVVTSDATGHAFYPLDYSHPPMNTGSGQIAAGGIWNFQYWYRDPAGPGGTGFNASNAMAITYCP